MVLCIKNNHVLKVILLALAIVSFYAYFYLIPPFYFFIVILLICILNFWARISKVLICSILMVSVMLVWPQFFSGIITRYFNNTYGYIILSSLVIFLISYIGGHFFVYKNKIKKSYLLCFILICFLGATLFRNPLLHERFLLNIYFFLISVMSLYLGAYGRDDISIPKLHNSILLLSLALTFIIPNYLTKPQITRLALIECFNRWANTTTDYSIKNITMKGGYSYSLLKEMLQNKYFLITVKAREELGKALEEVNVALIITPTIPMDTKEIQAIREFVSRGGRLVVIADHTDLYGHARVMNSFLNSMGIYVEYDALFNIQSYHSKILLSHVPINTIEAKTPCSFVVTSPAYIFGWAPNWISEKADYTRPNFFGELKWTTDDVVGNWPVGGIVKYGKGEVVFWGDSTMFANFSIFQPDVLGFLGNLIEKGFFVGFFYYHFFWVLGLCIFLIIFRKMNNSNFLIISCFALVLLSGLYYLWNCNSERFYSDNNRIDIYGEKNLFEEPLPNSAPQEGHMSSAFSHIARCSLCPLYVGEKPNEVLANKSIWITRWDEVIGLNSNILNSLWGVVVVDIDDRMMEVGFHKTYFEDNVSEPFKEFFSQKVPPRQILITANDSHTVEYGGTSILAGNGILTDRYLGNWWITTDISPYRRFILNEWFNWLIDHDNMHSFIYPVVGVAINGKTWRIKFQKKEDIKKKISITPYEKDRNFVYVGSGLWALYQKKEDKEYLVGGLEVSDDYLRSGNLMWAAETVDE